MSLDEVVRLGCVRLCQVVPGCVRLCQVRLGWVGLGHVSPLINVVSATYCFINLFQTNASAADYFLAKFCAASSVGP